MKLDLILWGVLAVVGLGFLMGGLHSALATDVVSIGPVTLEGQMASQNPPLVLDVREPSETAMGTIENAKLIPLSVLETRLSELPKDRLIAVYCRSGHRSMRAISILQSKGFTMLENLTGGFNAWADKCSSDKKFC